MGKREVGGRSARDERAAARTAHDHQQLIALTVSAARPQSRSEPATPGLVILVPAGLANARAGAATQGGSIAKLTFVKAAPLWLR